MAKIDKKKLAEACDGLKNAVVNRLCNENVPKKPEDLAKLFETKAEKAIEESNKLLPAAFARTLKKETEALAKMLPNNNQNNNQNNEIMKLKKHNENQNTENENQKLKEDTERTRMHYGMLLDHHIIDFDMFENKVGKENVPEILQEYNKILMKCELAEYEADFIGICRHGKVDCALQMSCLIGLKCNHEHEHSNAKMCYMNKQGGELETFLLKNSTSVPKLLEMERTIAETQQEKFAKNAFSAYDTHEHQPKERVNHPKHYQHPSGVKCITVARHHDFNIGNALKHLFRAGLKQEQGISPLDKQIEDLQKSRLLHTRRNRISEIKTMNQDIFTSSDTHFYKGSDKIHLFDTFYAEIWQSAGSLYNVFLYTELKGIKKFKTIGLNKHALTKEKAYEIVEWAKNNKEWFEHWLKYTLKRITEETDYESNKVALIFKSRQSE